MTASTWSIPRALKKASFRARLSKALTRIPRWGWWARKASASSRLVQMPESLSPKASTTRCSPGSPSKTYQVPERSGATRS